MAICVVDEAVIVAAVADAASMMTVRVVVAQNMIRAKNRRRWPTHRLCHTSSKR
jgi:hypothetical protein